MILTGKQMIDFLVEESRKMSEQKKRFNVVSKSAQILWKTLNPVEFYGCHFVGPDEEFGYIIFKFVGIENGEAIIMEDRFCVPEKRANPEKYNIFPLVMIEVL